MTTKGVTTMAADPLKHHYACLTAPERFALTIEAMARGDENEADRLEDACPTHSYHMHDLEYRDRMRRAYLIALMVSLNMREGLAQIRMAKIFCGMAPDFGRGPELLAKTAFLYGREYGKWEAGKIEQIGLIDPKALVAELEADPELRRQMDDIKDLVPDAMKGVADALQDAVGEAFAVDVLSQWEGFGRFCREALAVDPLTLLKALRLAKQDPAADLLEVYPESVVDDAKAAEWESTWQKNWDRRFSGRAS
jgi:hypothetical protein